jgi:glycosyltransferase involved in cell wall biosynthesis
MSVNVESKAVFPLEFSVVIPVRNGGEYIKECVNSILAQTVQNFDLIILDNASTDGTVAWLRSLNDSRITIYPSDQFLAIEQNWDRIKTVPRKKWMMITGHDDIMHPNYLEVISALIQKHPDASLYQPHFNFIDENGLIIEPCTPMSEKQSAADFFRVTKKNGGGFMMRSADYDAVGGIPAYPSLFFSDFALWIELSRISYKATAPENCFSYRVHSKNTTSTTGIDLYQNGIDCFVTYLYSLKSKDPAFRKVLNEFGKDFLSTNCRSVAHRILKAPVDKRGHLSVELIINKYRDFANLLIDNNTFDPADIPGMRLARTIDKFGLTRNLFLQFKKIYSKPLYR